MRAESCPQCGSEECGPWRCRFSLLPHSTFREQAEARMNAYVDAMIRRDLAGEPREFGVSPCWRSDKAGR